MDPVTGLALVIQNIGAIVTGVVSWIGSYLGAVMSSGSELLFIYFSLGLIGLGIGALKRLAS